MQNGIPSGGEVVVRHSRIATYRQCPLKEHLEWRGQWRQKEDSYASSLGTIWHYLMAQHYRGLRAYQHNGAKAIDPLRTVSEPVWEWLKEWYGKSKHIEILEWMYKGHLDAHGMDEHWVILEVEQTDTVPLMPGFLYEWTTDLLVLDKTVNAIRIVDQKSTSSKLRSVDIDLSDQLGLYIAATRRRSRPEARRVLDGVISQAITAKLKRHQTLEERYQRPTSYRTDIELENIWEDACKTVRAMYSLPDGEVPYSSPDPRTCSWKCDFVEPHLILRKTAASKWDRVIPPLMRSQGFVQKEAPRGSDTPTRG